MKGYEKMFIIQAEDNLKCLIQNGFDETLLENMWNTLNKYADIRKNEYEEKMKSIPKERLTILYNTYVVEKRKIHSCVYFVKNTVTGKYKIGASSFPLIRLKQLKKQYGFMNIKSEELELVGCIYTPCNEMKIEKYYHKMFDQYRENGEWFNIPQNEIDEIFSNNTLEGIKIKVKYENGLYDYDGFEEVLFENIDNKNLMGFIISDLCKRRFVTEEVLDIDFFKEVIQILNDYHGNHILLFDNKKPKSFELFEWLVEDDLLEMASNGDIGFVEEYIRAKKECLSEYFKEYEEK